MRKDGNITTHTVSVDAGYVPAKYEWSFNEVGLSGINAADDRMLAGTVSVDASGQKITGNIPTVTASLENDVVTVPKGYIAEPQTFEVGSSGGSSMEFFKCAAVYGPRKVERIRVSEAGTATVNGDYEKTSFTTSTGGEVWKHLTADCYLYNLDGYWCINLNNYATWGESSYYYTYNSDLTQWNVGYNWSDELPTGADPAPSVSKIQVTLDADVPKTWDGYKAVLIDGVYSFEETLTTGLTYGTSYVPVVGGIYSADTVIRVSGIYMPGVWTSPDNLTANDSNPDFIVDQSSSYNSGTVAFNAFDGSLNVGNYGSGTYNSSDHVDTAWISIELADIKKVNYLKLISAGYSDGCQPASFNFEYSDDGSTWTPCLEVRGLTKAWWNTPSVGTEHEWAVELDSAHPYYRLNMLSRTDGVSYNIQRMEIGYKA
jgi:hypothetical protein